jgi:cellulose synthase/poly-beta-1,6-N-acetylglucosamine synthase-like glycosyltransferase
MELILQIVFWLGLFYLVYVEIGYLLILAALAKLHPQRRAPGDAQPTLTVLIAAHNEEAVISQRLENILAQGYPPQRLGVIVASDGSTDGTEQVVREYAGRGVVLVPVWPQGGKIAALRAAEEHITSEVVVFTDADSHFEPGVLQTLARHFDDPGVGAVTGREKRQVIDLGKGEGLFNRIENLTRYFESKIGDQVMLNGGIFAIRRDLLPYVPDHLTHDGVVAPQLHLQGYRILYDPEAVSLESYNLTSAQDWHRRLRTVSQAFQSYIYVKDALNPCKSGWYALQIWSHRLMRWLLFPVMLLVLISNLLLLGAAPFYQVFALLQGTCYLLALIGFLLDKIGKQSALFYFPYYFVYIHLAAFFAVVLSLKGQKVTTWQVVERQV